MEYTYLELKNAVINALANFRSSRLRELSSNEYFEDVIDEIESEMGITITRFWEN